MTVSYPAHLLSPDKVERLRRAVYAFPGDEPVYLVLTSPGAKSKKIRFDGGVDPHNHLAFYSLIALGFTVVPDD